LNSYTLTYSRELLE